MGGWGGLGQGGGAIGRRGWGAERRPESGVPDRRCTDPVPELQAAMQDRAVEKHPREQVEGLIDDARELCDQGATEEALYELSLATQLLEGSAIDDPTSQWIVDAQN
jgi:hypothetical protein